MGLATEVLLLGGALSVAGDDEVLVGELEGFADRTGDGWDGRL